MMEARLWFNPLHRSKRRTVWHGGHAEEKSDFGRNFLENLAFSAAQSGSTSGARRRLIRHRRRLVLPGDQLHISALHPARLTRAGIERLCEADRRGGPAAAGGE